MISPLQIVSDGYLTIAGVIKKALVIAVAGFLLSSSSGAVVPRQVVTDGYIVFADTGKQPLIEAVAGYLTFEADPVVPPIIPIPPIPSGGRGGGGSRDVRFLDSYEPIKEDRLEKQIKREDEELLVIMAAIIRCS